MSSYVFIDSRVRNYDLLLASLAPDAQVVILDSAQDGLEQISQVLEGVTDLDAIHIISHGAEGTVYLGDTVLTGENLNSYSSELATIGAALSETGDILLYGCEVANGVTGQRFIEDLALYTGADVAASTDYTGSTALRGDWVLEANTGTIEAQSIAVSNFEGVLAPPAVTTSGTLDKTFDTDGIRVDTIGTSGDLIYGMALQIDGKIVVAGYSLGTNAQFAVARYNANGSLDSTFDGDGKLTTAISTSSGYATSVALQADGKIVVAGYALGGGSNDFALARYNSNGTLDTTFDADGKRTDPIGTGNDQINSVALQADGKIVVGGVSSTSGLTDFALARYNTDGSLDTTFDTDGKRVDTIGANYDDINSLVVQVDGKIVAAGSSTGGFTLARYNTDGSLDSTFDGDGKRTDAIGAFSSEIASMALQADGRIVVAGRIYNGSNFDFALARYNANGTLDTTFGSGASGAVTTDFGASGDEITSVALQADGRIVVAGYSGPNGDSDFVLARYTTSGVLDTTFDGDGKLTLPVGTLDNIANSVKVQSDGTIVVAGYSSNGTNDDFAVARVAGSTGLPDVAATENAPFSFTFNGNTFTDPEGQALTYTTSALPSWLTFVAATRTFSGTPGSGDVGTTVNITVTATDTAAQSVNDSFEINVLNNDPPVLTLRPDLAFGGDGVVTTPIGTGSDQINSVALQADGKIVVGGFSSTSGLSDFALARYNTDGSLDSTFDGDGKRTDPIGTSQDVINSLTRQADGKIVVAGYSKISSTNDDFALARYNSNGSLDTTFGTGGKVTTAIGTSYDLINSTVLQADGRIVVAGASHNGTDHDFALARYTTSGTLDSTFGSGGVRTDTVGTGTDYIFSMALQTDGRIVVAGSAIVGGNDDFALARYNSNGTLDTTFDTDGKRTDPIGTSSDVITGVVLQADGKIVAAGASYNGADYDFALARYTTNGSLDSTFGTGGKVITPVGTGNDFIMSIVLQADGKIVATGWSRNATGTDDFALARYHADGSLDMMFDGDGKFTTSLSTGHDQARSLVLQSDGSIVAAGTAGGDFALLRLRAYVPDQFATEEVLFTSSALNWNTFADPEGSAVTYSATRANGSALPAWLSFNPFTRVFSGTPLNADVGPLAVKLSATDNWGATSSTTFTIDVANTNDAPVASSIPGKSVFITSTLNFAVTPFTDVDAGDVLTYSATLSDNSALPAWISFNPATRAFSITPPPEEAGSIYTIKVIVTDTGDATASTTFNLNVTGSYWAGQDGLNDTVNGTGADDYIDGKSGADTMTGFGGDDTYIVDNTGDVIVEAGSAGTDRAQSGVTYTLSSNVENLLLTGVGNINGTGNNLVNEITGNGGNNRLDGGTGIDLLNGGLGNDTYVLDNVNDQVNENVNAGTDGVEASNAVAGSTFVLTANVENLSLMGATNINGQGNGDPNILTGNSGNNHLIGGGGNDTLNGLGGNDTLDGGTGADSMSGGTGDDLYIVDNAGDATVEQLSQGIDTVQSSVTRTLSANIEHLTLTGVGVINGTGNTLSNHITGNSQNNLLSGGGGTNGDTIEGGDGNDSLTGTDGADTLDGGQGNDTLIGAGGNDSLEGGSGNGDDSLVGGAGNDTLRGGSGTDTMDGGSGNDVYHVDTASDVVIEAADASGGTADQVVIAVNFTTEPEVFQLYAGIERVSVFDVNAFVLVTGNDLDNLFDGANGADSLNGAAGQDTLNGGLGNDTLDGGTGTDTMKGGSGNDLYYVDNVLDVVEETDVAPGALIAAIALVEGFIDTVNAAVNYSLTQLVENLTLTGTATTGTGNELDNQISGNTLNNTLTGAQGDDTLDGGAGTDIATYAGNSSDYQITTVNGTTTVTDLNTGNGDDGADTLTNIETLRFSNLDIPTVSINTITGDAGNNSLTGASGADSISGNGGNDTLVGGAGNDTLNGGDGNDTITGGDGNDSLKGDAGDDNLNGGTGTDTASYAGAASAVTVTLSTAVAQQNTGGAGLDTLTSIEHLLGSSFNDTFTGSSAANQLDGALGNDTLTGGTGNDTLLGSDGNDTLKGEAGDDSLSGGTGTDTASYAGAASAVTVTLSTAVAQQNTGGAGLDTLTSIEHLLGSSYNDTFAGNSAANQLDGALGNDTLTGGTGNDTLLGSDGNDTLKGEAGDDSLSGGTGTDTASYAGTASAVTVTLATAVGQQNTVGAGLDTLTSIEHLLGGSFNDTFTGNSAANQLDGATGNDTLTGGTGNDTLLGGTGNDSLSGGDGNDMLRGDAGNDSLNGGSAGSDTASYVGTASAVTVTLSTAVGQQNTVGAGLDTLISIEHLLGGSFNDTFTGNSAANKLEGGSGNDTLSGGSANDTLVGGNGADRLTGGTGVDLFDYNALAEAGDTITDFTAGAGGDKIDLDTLLTVLGYGGADPMAAGYVRVLQSTTNALVQIDSNGGGDNFATTLATLTNVTAANVTLADNFIV